MKIVPKDTYVATNYQNWLSPFVYLRPRYFYPSLNILKTEKKYSRPSLSLKLFKIETYFYEKITQTFSSPTVNVYRVRFLSFFYLLFLFSSFHNSNESKLPIERKQNSTSFSLPLFSFFSLLSSSFSHRFPLLNACAFASRRPPLPPPSLARGSLLPPHTFSVKTKPREKSVSSQPAGFWKVTLDATKGGRRRTHLWRKKRGGEIAGKREGEGDPWKKRLLDAPWCEPATRGCRRTCTQWRNVSPRVSFSFAEKRKKKKKDSQTFFPREWNNLRSSENFYSSFIAFV